MATRKHIRVSIFETTDYRGSNLWVLYAEGEDINDLKQLFVNVPFPKDADSCTWVGETAEFLINNIKNAYAFK